MSAYISIPRDLTRVKSKVLFNLTKRQLICFGAAALIGVPFFFLLKAAGNVSLAALGMILVMLPLFFLAMYEKGRAAFGSCGKAFHSGKVSPPESQTVSDRQLLCRCPAAVRSIQGGSRDCSESRRKIRRKA